MDAEFDEFQDWELLHHNPDSESLPPNSFDEIDSPAALIQADYFSLDSLNRYKLHDLDDNKSAVSDNPSWIDPENPTRYPNKESTEFWSDSSSDRSEDRNKFTDFLLSNQMGFYAYQKNQVGFQGIKEVVDEKGDQVVELGRVEANSVGSEATANSDNELELPGKVQPENSELGNGNERGDGIDKKGVVWWNMPMEFLRYFVFRMSPVWTVSVAAAVMGFVILGRRLYKMKKKNTRGLQIKVAVDDKVSTHILTCLLRNLLYTFVCHKLLIYGMLCTNFRFYRIGSLYVWQLEKI